MKSIIAYIVSIYLITLSSAYLNNHLYKSHKIKNIIKATKTPELVRGERYNNDQSSIPHPSTIASRLKVKPTKEASPQTWKRAWKIHKRLLPLLHSTDTCKPPDSSLNLACMWWKALSGLDKSSPVYDKGLSYDLLPSGWRRIIRLRRLFPRLHHGNVELRTAYLDNAIEAVSVDRKVRLICMGAGYDTRGIKMIERGVVDEVVELDLQDVVTGKERLLKRLLKRRPWLKSYPIPQLIPSNLNNLTKVKHILQDIIPKDDKCNVFTFEGVMIYLDDNVPSQLLNITSSVLMEKECDGCLVFADRLENVPGGDYDLGREELERNGWVLEDWCPKPGLARHMGYCRIAR